MENAVRRGKKRELGLNDRGGIGDGEGRSDKSLCAKPQAAEALEQRPHNLFSTAGVGRAPYHEVS
jgi:hypothetical protein